jgi:hypothetical protein
MKMTNEESGQATLEQKTQGIQDIQNEDGNYILNNTNSYCEFFPERFPQTCPFDLKQFDFDNFTYKVMGKEIDEKDTKKGIFYQLCDLKQQESGNIKSVVIGYFPKTDSASELRQEQGWEMVLMGDIKDKRKDAAISANRKNNLSLDIRRL